MIKSMEVAHQACEGLCTRLGESTRVLRKAEKISGLDSELKDRIVGFTSTSREDVATVMRPFDEVMQLIFELCPASATRMFSHTLEDRARLKEWIDRDSLGFSKIRDENDSQVDEHGQQY